MTEKDGKTKTRRKGHLYVVSAPSGCGKTTLCDRLLKTAPGLTRSVSVTTRPPRRGEREGKDYFFISREAFQNLRKEKELLEWTEYAHSFYGTPLKPLQRSLKEGEKIILLLDVRGAHTVKKHFKDATTIFLFPPTLGDLKSRLRGRRTEKGLELAKRLRMAEKEVAQADWYDHVVVNDDLNRALRELRQIVRRP